MSTATPRRRAATAVYDVVYDAVDHAVYDAVAPRRDRSAPIACGRRRSGTAHGTDIYSRNGAH